MLTIQQIINTPVSSNCFVIYDKAVGRECAVVDPGSKSDEVLFAFIDGQHLEPKYVILTHEHFDHCWGVNEFVERYHVPIVCSALCAEYIKYVKKNCSVFYDNKESFVITSPTITVESLDFVLPFAGSVFRIFITPGHTDAGICFSFGKCLFTGDTLIKNLHTVTKLPTGSVAKLELSMKSLRALMGNGYTVYPGHGEVFELDSYDLGKMINERIS